MPRRQSRREAIVLTFSRASLWLAAMGACVLVLGFGLGGYSLGRETNTGPETHRANEVAQKSLVAPAAKVAAAKPAVVLAPPDDGQAADPPAAPAVETAVEAPVVEAPVVEAPVVEAPAPLEFLKAPRSGYGIQLGAFESEQEAKDFAQSFRAVLDEMPVHIVSVTLKKRGTWHRVRVGKFSSKRSAERARKTLPAELADASISVSYP